MWLPCRTCSATRSTCTGCAKSARSRLRPWQTWSLPACTRSALVHISSAPSSQVSITRLGNPSYAALIASDASISQRTLSYPGPRAISYSGLVKGYGNQIWYVCIDFYIGSLEFGIARPSIRSPLAFFESFLFSNHTQLGWGGTGARRFIRNDLASAPERRRPRRSVRLGRSRLRHRKGQGHQEVTKGPARLRKKRKGGKGMGE